MSSFIKNAPARHRVAAWLLTASLLVLFMPLPGLARFYAGLVRTKNVLSVLMQCFAITCVVTDRCSTTARSIRWS